MAASTERGRIALAAVLLAGGLGWGLERLIVTETERLMALPEALGDTLEVADRDGFAALLEPTFSYEGPRPLTGGDRQEALSDAALLWSQAASVGVDLSQIEVRGRTEQVAQLFLSGRVRFRWQDSLVVYRVSGNLECVKEGEDWQARHLVVTELRPGLF